MSSDLEPPKKRRPGRPSTGETPIRSVRVPDDVWHAAIEAAQAEHTTVSAWVIEDLQRRIRRHQRHGDAAAPPPPST